VIDADALNALAAQGLTLLEPLRCPAVFTPHPGEMLRLGQRLGLEPAVVPEDETSRIHHAVIAARKLKHTVLLKGHRTVVSDGQRLYVNRTGDSSLSKAGAGDVLAGVIGSLMGQGMSAFDGACAAAWIHGRAGELAGAELGRRSALARDVIAQLGRAIAEYERRHA
ncbi:MAG: NAD(P)H-hydrate dehydratase, partial [Phycisphaerae bacterium]|nr:NAD(P)H-hydrate dehydratase [Phycisphaerae bacterium]